MKTTAEILLQNIKSMRKLFPGVYDKLDDIRKTKRSSWPEECYIPRQEIIWFMLNNQTLFREKEMDFVSLNVSTSATASCSSIDSIFRSLCVTYNWRSHKKIYRFDPDLAKMLCDQADNDDPYKMELPYNILLKLPFNGMYIEAPIDENISGTYIFIDYMNGIPILVMNNVSYLNQYSHIISVPDPSDLELHKGKSVGECMDITSDRIKSKKNGIATIAWDPKMKKYSRADKIQWRIINLLMYILAANADIQQSEETRDTYRARNKDDDKPFRDNYREIDQLNVGYRIGDVIRASRGSVRERAVEEFKRIPHVRRGHWHRYWVGSRSSTDRDQIIKWIPPIFVNGYNENFNIVSVTPVE